LAHTSHVVYRPLDVKLYCSIVLHAVERCHSLTSASIYYYYELFIACGHRRAARGYCHQSVTDPAVCRSRGLHSSVHNKITDCNQLSPHNCPRCTWISERRTHSRKCRVIRSGVLRTCHGAVVWSRRLTGHVISRRIRPRDCNKQRPSV